MCPSPSTPKPSLYNLARPILFREGETPAEPRSTQRLTGRFALPPHTVPPLAQKSQTLLNSMLFSSVRNLPWICLLAIAMGAGLSATEPPPSRLVVPPVFYAVEGVPLSIYFQNALRSPLEKGETLEVQSEVGSTRDSTVWNLTATDAQEGDHAWTLRLKDTSGQVVEEANTVIRVVPATAGADRDLTLLLVGDSLTHLSLYPNEIARLLNQPGNPRWKMLGLHHPSVAGTGVAHEGYGGWTWERFNTQYFPDKPPGSNLGSSPFVFPEGPDGKPTLDVARYLQEHFDGRQPDIVIFFLGINDCIHANAKDPAAIDASIDAMFAQAEVLLANFRQALSNAEFGIALTPAPNGREEAFDANYKGSITQSGWRQIQYRLVERQLEHFGARENDKISIIPLSLAVDAMAGYPPGNAVHPNPSGFQDIGDYIYGWIKSGLERPTTETNSK